MKNMSNTAVAALIGLTHAQVSRIRSGDRLPSIETMMNIHKVFGWSMDEQATARLQNLYGPRFEEAIGRYASTRNTTEAPEERAPEPQ